MKLEMVCIQLCQGAVSAWCTDKPCIVDSVPDHMVVVAFQEHVTFLPVVVPEPTESWPIILIPKDASCVYDCWSCYGML